MADTESSMAAQPMATSTYLAVLESVFLAPSLRAFLAARSARASATWADLLLEASFPLAEVPALALASVAPATLEFFFCFWLIKGPFEGVVIFNSNFLLYAKTAHEQLRYRNSCPTGGLGMSAARGRGSCSAAQAAGCYPTRTVRSSFT